MKAIALKFLADECCDAQLISSLRGAGYDVVYALESYRGKDDTQILNAAYSEGRLLLTEDKDFGELCYRLRKPTIGIILLRISVEERHKKWDRLKVLIEKYAEKLPDSFVVVDLHNYRFRALK